MTSRDRVLKTFRFEPTDRPACDLMEGIAWDELDTYLRDTHQIDNYHDMLAFLGTDCRWISVQRAPDPEEHPPPPCSAPPAEEIQQVYSMAVARGPLADATTVAEVETYMDAFDPARYEPCDYAAERARWPDHALVLGHTWIVPLFWGTCQAFGMEEALVQLHSNPRLVEAFIRRQNEYYLDIMDRATRAAQGHCDICWLGDDYAGQENMILSPDLWRRHIKPHLAKQVRMARERDMYVLLHSCGAIRGIIPDLIDIGVNGLLVFQTTARGMDAESIAREFGGKIAFYGGMDVQGLLSYASTDEVRATVRSNVRAFENCGGYMVANSHHCVSTIRGENIIAMFDEARNLETTRKTGRTTPAGSSGR
ncbi:MAG: hypothetical protein HQ559_10900 [Lentisphaerae bacterium]|nr:hypothetical protein [Lentisphaerota bacterium]